MGIFEHKIQENYLDRLLNVSLSKKHGDSFPIYNKEDLMNYFTNNPEELQEIISKFRGVKINKILNK